MHWIGFPLFLLRVKYYFLSAVFQLGVIKLRPYKATLLTLVLILYLGILITGHLIQAALPHVDPATYAPLPAIEIPEEIQTYTSTTPLEEQEVFWQHQAESYPRHRDVILNLALLAYYQGDDTKLDGYINQLSDLDPNTPLLSKISF